MMCSFRFSIAELYYNNHNMNSFGKQNNKVNMEAKRIHHSNGLLFKTTICVGLELRTWHRKTVHLSSFKDKNYAIQSGLKLILIGQRSLVSKFFVISPRKIIF